MMKNTMMTILALAVIALVPVACGPAIDGGAPTLRRLSAWPMENRYLTAVFPFAYNGRDARMAVFTAGLPDMCVDELFRTGRFRIVERSRIDAVLKEVGLAQSGVVIDATRAGRIGRRLGAELILVGSVEEIRPIGKRDSIGSPGRSRGGSRSVSRAG